MEIWAVGEVDIPHKTTGILWLVVKGKKETIYQVGGERSVPLQQANENWVFVCYTSDRINLSRHLINI